MMQEQTNMADPAAQAPPVETVPGYGRRARLSKMKSRQQMVRPALPWPGIQHRYAWIFAAIVTLFLLYFDRINPNHKQPLTLLLASSIFFLSCLPMFFFLLRGRAHQVPLVEAHAMFYAICFGWAGFLPFESLTAAVVVSEADIQVTLMYTLAGISVLLFGYYVVGARLFRKVRPVHFASNLTNSGLGWLGWGSCAMGFAMNWLGRNLATGALAQVGSMIYSLGFFLLLILTFEGKVNWMTRIATVLLLLPIALLLQSGLSSGQLAGVVTMVCWISLIILRVWRRVPIYLLVGAFVFFIIFQPVKFYVRTFTEEQGAALGPLQTFQVYVEGFRETYGSAGALMANPNQAFDNSFVRINHLLTSAAIIRDTPSSQPYLYGKSYWPLLTKWIPRALWPGKPMEEYGNSWAKEYGFLNENDTTTSFNLPWLPEMYMNFGPAGIIGIMFSLGVFYHFLWKRIMEQPTRPAECAVAIMFAHSLVFVETNFSLQFGGIIILTILLWSSSKLLKFSSGGAASA
jgi:hypothetical protein